MRRDDFLFVACVFSVLSIVLSFALIVQHLLHYTQPQLQKSIVRIVLMVPTYSSLSFLSLMYPEHDTLFSTIRELYEAYVIYVFLALCIGYLGGTAALILVLEEKPAMKHPWPFNYCCAAVRPDVYFLRSCKQQILQYVFVKPACSLVGLLLSFWGLYDEGHVDFSKGYIYLVFISNISVSVSLYALILFYMATEKELAPFSPLLKFLCVKSVIFMTFWQSIGIAILVYMGIIHDLGEYDANTVASSIQNFIVCIEMFLASIAHMWAFGYRDYVHPAGPRQTVLESLGEVISIRDMFTDAHDNFLKRPGRKHDRELSVLLGKDDGFLSE